MAAHPTHTCTQTHITTPSILIPNDSSEPPRLQLAQNPRPYNLALLIRTTFEENFHNSFHAMDRIVPIPPPQHALALEFHSILVPSESHILGVRTRDSRPGDFAVVVEVLGEDVAGLREDEVRVRVAAEVGDGLEDAVI